MNSSQLSTTLANAVAQYSQPLHPLVRIDYEYTVATIGYDERVGASVPLVNHTPRSCVAEVVQLDYKPTLPNTQFTADWERLCRTRRSDGTGFNHIRPCVLQVILEHSVIPELFLSQFYDKDHPNGINVHVQNGDTKSHSHAIRFYYNDRRSSDSYLDIFRIEKIA